MERKYTVGENLKEIEETEYIEIISRKNEYLQNRLEMEQHESRQEIDELKNKLAMLKSQIHILESHIKNIESSLFWRALTMYKKILDKLLRPGTMPRLYYDKTIIFLQKKLAAKNCDPNSNIDLDISNYKSSDILFVGHEESRTGSPRVLFNIVSFVKKLIQENKTNFKSFSLVSLRKGGMHEEFKKAFGQNIYYPKLDYENEDRIKIAEKIIKKISPKLCYINTIDSYCFAIASKTLGIPTIFHVHELDHAFDIVLGEKKSEFKNFADKYIVPSKSVRDLLVKIGCDAEKIFIIPECIDQESIINGSRKISRKSIMEAIGANDDQKIIIGVGTFIKRKGGDLFAKLAELAEKKYPKKFKFVWVGKKPTVYESLTMGNIGYRHFKHIDEVSNPYPYIKNSDLLAMTSREDPFPLVVLEAMTLGVPTVTFKDSGGAKEAINNPELVVTNFDPEEMLDVIHHFLTNSQKIADDKEKIQKLSKQYDWRNVLENLFKEHLSPFQPGVDGNKILEKTTINENRGPIFIIGSARSGTSMIVQMLMNGANIFGFSEGHIIPILGHINTAINTYQEKLPGIKNNPNVALSHLNTDDLRKHVLEYVKNKMNHLMGNRTVWFDKTPDFGTITNIKSILAMWPDARFIFMKRRPLENINSRIKKFKEVDFETNCRKWQITMEKWLEARKELDAGQFIEIEQRDLSLKPELVVSTLASFLNIDEDKKKLMLNILKNNRPEFTGGNENQILSLEKINWNKEEKNLFKSICGPIAEKYNYALDDRYYLTD